MEVTRSKYSNYMCAIFSGALFILFCQTIGEKVGIDNLVSRTILAAVYCGLFVVASFGLNKLSKFIISKTGYGDEDTIFKVAIIIESIIFVLLRLLVIADVIKVEFETTAVFDMAKIGEGGYMFIDVSTFNKQMATILSSLFMFTGNVAFPIYLVQFVFSCIGFALIIAAVKDIAGKMSAAFVGFGVAVLPVFYQSIANDRTDCMLFMVFSLFLFISAKYRKYCERNEIKWYLTFIIGVFSGILSLQSVLFLFLFALSIILICNNENEDTSVKVVNSIVCVIANIIGFVVPLLMDGLLIYGTGINGFVDSLKDQVLFRLTFYNDFTFTRNISCNGILFVVMTIAILYCVMFWRNNIDDGHVFATLFVLICFETGMIYIRERNAFIMVLAVCLLAVTGIGIVDVIKGRSLVKIVRISDDDMQPSEIASIDDKPAIKTEISTYADDTKEISKVDDRLDSDIKSEDAKIEVAVEQNAIQAKDDEKKESIDVSTDVVADNSDVSPAVNDVALDDVIDMNEANTADAVDDNISLDEAKQQETESRYSEPETRKTSDFGMNNADFESLFSGAYVPPKAVYNDYDYEETEDEQDNVSDNVDANAVENDYVLLEEETTTVEEETPELKENSDKKAYVDSFFGYLYDDSKFEPFDPIVEYTPTEEPEEEAIKEEYVSRAANFDDLELDLGVDAFDNVMVEANPVDASIQKVENYDANDNIGQDVVVVEEDEETDNAVIDDFIDASIEIPNSMIVERLADLSEAELIIEEIDAFDEEYNAGEVLFSEENNELISEAEILNEQKETVISDSNIVMNVDDSMVYAETTDIVEEEKPAVIEDDLVFEFNDNISASKTEFDDSVEFEIEGDLLLAESRNEDLENGGGDKTQQDFEDEIIKALSDFKVDLKEEVSIEELLEKKIDEDFSYEDAFEKRLDEEEIRKEIGFSYEEAFEKKLDVEEALEKANNVEFSFEEAISEKLVAEESMMNAEDNSSVPNISYVDAIEHIIEVEDSIEDAIEDNGFSIQETIEQKIDIERSIDDAINDDMLEEFGDADIEALALQELANLGVLSVANISDNEENVETNKSELFDNESMVIEEEISNDEEILFANNISETVEAENTIYEESYIDEKSNDDEHDMIIDAPFDNFFVDSTKTEATDTLEKSLDSVAEEDTLLLDDGVNEENVDVNGSVDVLYNVNAVENAPVEIDEGNEKNIDIEKENEIHVAEEPVELFENPLPLPKKHVHREIDYGRSIPWSWMHYDIELNEKNNHYDV